MEKLISICSDLLQNRVSISAAQDLVLKSHLNRLDKEISKIKKEKQKKTKVTR